MSAITAISSAILPLTTVFIPAPSCFNDIGWYSTSNGSVVYETGGTCLSPTCWFALPSTSDCFPSGWDLSATYSPGVCPHGYSVACSSMTTLGTFLETIGTCCPSGYSCLTQTTQPWFSTEPCAITWSPGPVNLTITYYSVEFNIFTVSVTDTVTYGQAILPVYAYSVQVRWQNAPPTILTIGDSTIFSTFSISSTSPTPAPSPTPMPSPTSPSTSTTSIMPAASSTATPKTSESNTGAPSSDSDALALESNRIALGVGLGIGLPTLFFTILGVWCHRAAKNRRDNNSNELSNLR